MNLETMPCTTCGTATVLVARTKPIPVAGVVFEVMLPMYECPLDQTWVVPIDVHREVDRIALRSIATQGPANGTTLKFLRGSVKMQAKDLAELVDIAPETLSRWETGAKPVSPLVWVAVAAMALDQLDGRKTALKQLRSAHDTTASLTPVAIGLTGYAA